ncbi:hypothetical protein MAHJHV65_45140 [Mycobacterium avium subsp. hominissuis]
MTFDIGIPMSGDELDVLLHDRLDLSRADLVTALKMLPTYRTRTGSMTKEEAQLLDTAGMTDNPASHSRVSIEAVATLAWLVKTAYTADEVASGLHINTARIEQRRRARSLWAADHNGSWAYPAMQFDVIDISGRSRLKVVRHLGRVLRALPPDVHPLALAGFLLTPQQELVINDRPCTVRDWLSSGGALGPVLRLIDLGEGASA